MNIIKKALAMFLAVCMTSSIVPMAAGASDVADGEPVIEVESLIELDDYAEDSMEVMNVSMDTEDFNEEKSTGYTTERASVAPVTGELTYAEDYRILHLDCGRKYFSKDWIIALINEMSAAGYTHLELAVGNDNLRFLLDDMSVGNYTDDQVTVAIKEGNAAKHGEGELTQSEMDAILAHAESKEISVIPLLNTPGHMYAIVTAMKNLGMENPQFGSSASTVDVTNTTAVTFVQDLVKKYIDYFASRGCNEFNLGADEYANDDGNGQFSKLVSNGTYGNFIDYLNTLANYVVSKDMVPMAFNDGIYYNQTTTMGTIHPQIMVSYWSSGWWGYNLASASFLESKNFKMINTHGDYYYILGVNDCYTQGTTATHVGYDYTAAESFNKTVFQGSNIENPTGSMFCVWSDCPDAETEQEIAKNIRPILRIMSARMQDSNEYEVESVVVGGFNADGTINVVTPDLVTKTDDATRISVTAPGLTAVDITASEPVVTEEKVSKTYSITLNGGDYTGAAEVKIPYDNAFDGCDRFVGYVDGDEFDVTKDGEYFICDVPHFSDVEIEGTVRAVGGNTEDTIVAGSGTSESYVLDTDGLDDDAQYLIVSGTNALKNDKSSLTVNTSGNYATPNSDAADALWTYTVENSWSGYSYYLSNGNNYMYPSYNWNSRTYSLDINSTKTSVTISKQNTEGVYRIANAFSNSYVAYASNTNTWGAASSGSNLSFYKYTPGTQTFTVDPALQQSRITTLTVENAGYTDDSWNAYQTALTTANSKLTEVKGKAYTSETAANTALNELIVAVNALEAAKNALARAVQITVNYVDANGVTVKTETKNVAETADSVTLTSPIYSDDGKRYVVDDVNLVLALPTTTTYSVSVTEMAEDLTQVDPVHLEWWITNLPVNSTDSKVPDNSENSYTATSDGNTKTIYYSVITAEAAYGQNGMEITPSITVPATGSWPHSANLSYWKSTCLTEENKQNTTAGRDQTAAGTDFKFIRYFNQKWEVSYDRINWTTVNSTDQLVAYYLQAQEITPEIDVLFKDWGYIPSEGQNENVSSVALSVAVVYPDGTLSPAESSIYPDTSIIFNYWNGRDIGIVAPVNNSIYNISKITVTDGTRDQTSTKWSANDTITWEKVTNEAGSEWFDETTVWSVETDDSAPMVNGAADNAVWPKGNTAILVLIYLEPVEYENNLIVKWVDDNAQGALIHQMQVNISSLNEKTNFYDELKQTSALPTNGVGGSFTLDDTAYVVNSSGVPQTFNKDITIIHTVEAQYKSGLYKYVGADLDAEGLVLTLHYNVDPKKLAPMYVVDFGMPMVFSIEDLVQNPDDMATVEFIEQPKYGTAVLNTGTITYTPNKILQAIDVLPIKVTFNNGTNATVRVGIAPATTVYYEESFIDWDSNWTGQTDKPTILQNTAILGKDDNNYGYDEVYANNTGASNGTSVSTSTLKAKGTFTFTGNGLQVFANATEGTGYVAVSVKNTVSGEIVKLAMVDTVVSQEKDQSGNSIPTGATSGQTGEMYGLPIVSLVNLTGLTHATYEVTITKIIDEKPVFIDGIRVFNTVLDTNSGDNAVNNIYYDDQEDNPVFHELRDYVLAAIEINDSTSEDYGKLSTMAKQVYAGISSNGEAPVAVITNKDIKNIYGEDATAQDLLDNGPKNELFLYKGQTLTFSVSTNRVMQIGLKAPKGTSSFTLKVNDTENALTSISSSVDMFYKIADKGGTKHTVSITVAADSNPLSVTLLKVCDDPNFAFNALTKDDIKNLLVDVYGFEPDEEPGDTEEPEDPVVTTATAYLDITFVNASGKELGTLTLYADGTVGENHVFTADEILEALEEALEQGYVAIADSMLADTTVKYGQSGMVKIQEYLDLIPEGNFDMDKWQDIWKDKDGKEYTVTASAGKNGSISREGDKEVLFNKNVTYIFTPDEGYEVCSVVIDGEDMGALSNFTFKHIREDHTISVKFCKEGTHDHSVTDRGDKPVKDDLKDKNDKNNKNNKKKKDKINYGVWISKGTWDERLIELDQYIRSVIDG